MSETEKVRITPTIPVWLRDAIEPDVGALGFGARSQGGDRSVVMTALLIYLRLPREERLRIARLAAHHEEDVVRRELDQYWLIRAIQAVAVLGEEYSESLVGAAASKARRRSIDSGGTREARRA